jgi:hypothetical protein
MIGDQSSRPVVIGTRSPVLHHLSADPFRHLKAPRKSPVGHMSALIVLTKTGEALFVCLDNDQAQELMHAGQIEFAGKRNDDTYFTETLSVEAESLELNLSHGNGSVLDHTRHTYDYETETNPVNCWAMKRQPTDQARAEAGLNFARHAAPTGRNRRRTRTRARLAA